MSRIKLRAVRRGAHVHCSVFMAHPCGAQYVCNGALIFSPGEWQLFGAALLAARNAMAPGVLGVDFEGDSEAILAGAALDREEG